MKQWSSIIYGYFAFITRVIFVSLSRSVLGCSKGSSINWLHDLESFYVMGVTVVHCFDAIEKYCCEKFFSILWYGVVAWTLTQIYKWFKVFEIWVLLKNVQNIVDGQDHK